MSTEPQTSPTESSSNRSVIPEIETPAFGWTRYSERLNGRFAMIGLVAVLAIELVTGKGLLTWMGLL